MKTKNKPVRKAYCSPTEDTAIGHIMSERRKKQKRRRDREAYLLRKTAWEAAHPGKIYENRPRFNTQVWRESDP